MYHEVKDADIGVDRNKKTYNSMKWLETLLVKGLS